MLKSGKRIGFEVKYSDNPRTTRSMRIAIEDLKLDVLYIICPGSASYQLDEYIHVCGLEQLGTIF